MLRSISSAKKVSTVDRKMSNGETRVTARRKKRLERRNRNLKRFAIALAFVLLLYGVTLWLGPSALGKFSLLGGKTPAVVGPTQDPEPSIPEESLSALEQERVQRIRELAERPNELGKVPIIMYHVIGEPESEWVRTPQNFRNDLERFYRLGYSLVPLQAYLSGKMDVPEGATPLVLTFDDSTVGQFRLIDGNYTHSLGKEDLPEGKMPDPDCAVGILLEFSREHPDFGHAATFFADFPAPFDVPDEVEEKLNFLIACGMEVGNHTYNHKNLGDVSSDILRMEIGKQSNSVFKITGIKPLSLALPYGTYPKDKQVRKYLLEGEFEGVSYENRGILLVGAEAALSPYHKVFDPTAIPRIRGSEEEMSKWLKYLDDSGTRYISDGSLDTISFPEDRKENVADDLPDSYDVVVIPIEK